ncbi:MAG: hypothetical protein Q4G71_14355 [Pseudomonadota bacterium]|nr:hypothetical protein [Pseudomonadota bacterium]
MPAADLSAIAALMRTGQWHAAHDAIQHQDGLLAAWLHGLLHWQEGDLEDAEHWYDRAGRRFRQRAATLDEELALFDATLQSHPHSHRGTDVFPEGAPS